MIVHERVHGRVSGRVIGRVDGGECGVNVEWMGMGRGVEWMGELMGERVGSVGGVFG